MAFGFRWPLWATVVIWFWYRIDCLENIQHIPSLKFVQQEYCICYQQIVHCLVEVDNLDSWKNIPLNYYAYMQLHEHWSSGLLPSISLKLNLTWGSVWWKKKTAGVLVVNHLCLQTNIRPLEVEGITGSRKAHFHKYVPQCFHFYICFSEKKIFPSVFQSVSHLSLLNILKKLKERGLAGKRAAFYIRLYTNMPITIICMHSSTPKINFQSV